ncbi:BrnT family toxin [Salinarimonas ramus]|uniref:BrnT family toxin n=1 Tax=Salinarimonas ramus TaxID=690164 RepID=A0A917QGH8_9HYPH|nr:BrnT family toxin [Salinarimonas ramus]GGK49629.1 hypothetical protein GCM10011322_40790 [Salinarimonas ramus]
MDRPRFFEWDEAKAERNEAKHGVSFETASLVLLSEEYSDVVDDRHAYGEQRRICFAYIEDVLHAVVYTMRGETCRIISARRASRMERRRHGHRTKER